MSKEAFRHSGYRVGVPSSWASRVRQVVALALRYHCLAADALFDLLHQLEAPRQSTPPLSPLIDGRWS